MDEFIEKFEHLEHQELKNDLDFHYPPVAIEKRTMSKAVQYECCQQIYKNRLFKGHIHIVKVCLIWDFSSSNCFEIELGSQKVCSEKKK